MLHTDNLEAITGQARRSQPEEHEDLVNKGSDTVLEGKVLTARSQQQVKTQPRKNFSKGKKNKNREKNKSKKKKGQSNKRFMKENIHKEPQRKEGDPSKEDEIRHEQTEGEMPIPYDITNTVLEFFLIAVMATRLSISVLLSVGLLITWKQVHIPGTSHMQNPYHCSLKYLQRIATSKTYRLASFLPLINENQMTSAKMRKPQLQPYYECNRDTMTKNTEILAKRKAKKSSRTLRRLGKILQYKSNMDIIPFSPSLYLLLVSAYILFSYNADFFGSIYSIIIRYIQDWRKKDTNKIA